LIPAVFQLKAILSNSQWGNKIKLKLAQIAACVSCGFQLGPLFGLANLLYVHWPILAFVLKGVYF